MKKIELYDTTLRDGAQGEMISFTLEDKLKIAARLDQFCVDYIEGGWPGSNPKDAAFFQRVARQRFSHSRIVAFGSTRRKGVPVERDGNLACLLESGTEYLAIFGKSWDLHVQKVLRATLEENLVLIRDSVAFLKSKGKTVFFDAEHFFDGYASNPAYALATIQAAVEAGADRVVLCDTNGGCLPGKVQEAVSTVMKRFRVPVGIHTHNDSGLAVANALAAVEAGADHVQGTINGLGERCGNADLTTLVPLLQLKMGCQCVPRESMRNLTNLSRYVYEIANMVPPGSQPFVGLSAFTHKGGVHVDAVGKDPKTYEHVRPEEVGNQRKILVSELSGKSTVLQKMRAYGLEAKPEVTKKILEMVASLEKDGYQFEAAEGSFELLVRRTLGVYTRPFAVEGFRVIVEERGTRVVSEATVKVRVGPRAEHTAAEGNGPVNALDNALRKALAGFFPEIRHLRLVDYKVRILHPEKATGAMTRVLIESTDEKDVWGTVGLSDNIIEASWKALLDSVEFKILKDRSARA